MRSLFDSDGGTELLPSEGSATLFSAAIDPKPARDAFARLFNETEWLQRDVTVFGRTVPQPRLVAWFGNPGCRYTYSGMAYEPEPWTETLKTLRAKCEELACETFNSGLANLYRDGQDSVAWHADDEAELGSDPTIASLSLGAGRRFDLRHKETGETIKTTLMTGDLVVMSNGCQRNWIHQVPRMLRVREPRINLTFRHIIVS
ncbi:alpha-ketoglutarate-dependent dioxygenase AlkB [Acidimicrobiales bacterium]|nr:alpha-ketoglutarate-dependent dioxygenase AlkB [Acidimicrobiales bacterium]